jgi:hypothetical protein
MKLGSLLRAMAIINHPKTAFEFSKKSFVKTDTEKIFAEVRVSDKFSEYILFLDSYAN